MSPRALLICALLVTAPGVAIAADYESLAGEGYKAGKLTRGPNGKSGWFLSRGGDERYFCNRRAGLMYGGPTGIGNLDARDRFMPYNAAALKQLGADALDLPQLSDIEAGRLRSKDVGICGRESFW